MTRGERVCRFIERYCRVPEGPRVGRPINLLSFQRRFILAIYDAPRRVRRAYLSIARKNGKSALIACMVLAHLVGPEAVRNSQIVCGARSRDQASIVFKLALKMVNLSPELRKIVRDVPSSKTLVGLPMNVEFRAISAEAGTAHGLSPVLAIMDEVGQVKGPADPFIEAIETAQGAYDEALLIAISTQAATDADLFSQWLDDAETSGDPGIVSHLYAAPAECDLMDRDAWAAANPGLAEFRSLDEMEAFAEQAVRLPSKENSFRWLYLNQRIEASSPFVSQGTWKACGAEPARFDGLPVFCGLDLSEVADLTAFVPVGIDGELRHVRPTFWLPGTGLAEKSRSDRVPYELWAKQGFLQATPGPSVDYQFVAAYLWDFCGVNDVRVVAFDRWGMKHLKPWLLRAGFRESQFEGDDPFFLPFGQGYASMSPALRDLEGWILNGQLRHGNHPVLAWCARNAAVQMDPAGSKKLSKIKSHGRIDGMVALAMAAGAAGTWLNSQIDVAAMVA